MDDQVIIDWYWERSEYAIVATKKKYGSYCHRVSYNILQNREDTEECLNDLYMKAWESIPADTSASTRSVFDEDRAKSRTTAL